MTARTAVLAMLATFSIGSHVASQPPARGGDDTWTRSFPIEPGELASTGRNDYFILEPGHQATFESGAERLVITVLETIKHIDGVDTRVVEERETKSGTVVEVSRNYFAISTRNRSVYYFGEDVDNYAGGTITNHGGSWLAGVNGARFGLAMPGDPPALKRRYYQEVAPRIAMDRAEIVGVAERVRTPAGEFTDCLKIEETTPLEPGVKEYKYYARGVGLVQDGSLKLVKSKSRDPQSAMRDPQSAMRVPQSAMRTPQSAIRVPQ